MNSLDVSNSLVIEPFLPKKTELIDMDDEAAILLDSVPELDSVYSIIKRIGHGTFSSVYLGHTKRNFTPDGRHHFAIKHIIPTSHPSRVYMELKCLKMMGGKDNIIEASFCLRNMNHIVLVMPYVPHDTFMDYAGTLTTEEICDYLLNLFIALKKVHGFSIIHRDIKPANFLYSRKHRRYALIDFGLAQEIKGLDTPQGHGSSLKAEKPKKFSLPLLETPHFPASRPVKRKLTTSYISSPYSLQSAAKKPRLASPAVNSLDNSVFSSTSTRINSSFVRRSPRKLPSSCRSSHKKENTPLTPNGRRTKMDETLNDSPSKHTRFAEAFRAERFSTGQTEPAKAGMSSCRKMSPSSSSSNTLRRSPRKSLNPLRWKSFVKGLNDSFENLSVRTNVRESSTLAASLSGYSASGNLNSGSREGNRRSSTLQEVKTSSGQSVLRPSSCSCYGSAQVCSICLGRRNQHAPRAGTPGFRAPEVLLRHPNQTTAVDMWSVGVILLCLLSGRYPFFRAVDDLSSLAEITTILGTKAIKKISANLGKLFTSSDDVPPLDLRKICEKLRNHDVKDRSSHRKKNEGPQENQDCCKGCRQLVAECVCLTPQFKGLSSLSDNARNPLKNIREVALQKTPETNSFKLEIVTDETDPKEQSALGGKASECLRNEFSYPSSLYDLLYRLLDPNPETRITAKDAISHSYIVQYLKR